MNIFNALYKMGVSFVMEDGSPRLRGERAKEAGKMFVLQRENLLEEAKMYPAIEGIEHGVIDMARAVASAWDWTEDDWTDYFTRVKDAGAQIALIYEAEQIKFKERYA